MLAYSGRLVCLYVGPDGTLVYWGRIGLGERKPALDARKRVRTQGGTGIVYIMMRNGFMLRKNRN